MHSSVRAFRPCYGGIRSPRPTSHTSPVGLVIARDMPLLFHHIFLFSGGKQLCHSRLRASKEQAIFIPEHLQLLMDLEHTMVKRNKRYFPVLLLALAQAKCYKTASDVTVLYILPAGTNHHLEENREESGPLLIGGPKDPYLIDKVCKFTVQICTLSPLYLFSM